MNILDAIKNAQAKDFDTLRGEFSNVPSRLSSPTSGNPIARAHFAMIRELARMQVPSLGVNAAAEDFEAVADYLTRITSMFDVFLQDVGAEVKDCAPCSVDMDCFAGKFFGAIDGFALFELDKCANEVRAEYQDEDAAVDFRNAELGHEGL